MNHTALGVQSVGWCIAIFGSLISITFGVNNQNGILGVAGVIACIVFGTILIGFGEIINLLSKLINQEDGIGLHISQGTEKDK